MTIVFLTHRVPYPPNKGDKLRAFHEIKFLARHHRICLCCLADNTRDLRYQDELLRYCQSVDIVYLPAYQSNLRSFGALFSNTALSLAYFYSKPLRSVVAQKIHAQRPDLVFVFSSSMAQYVHDVRHIPKVMDFVDVDSEKWAQYARHAKFPYNLVYRSESRRLRRYENFLAKTFQHGFLVSEKETRDFRDLVFDKAPLTAISNGVDTQMFQPSREPYDPNTLVFTGAMDYFANVETMLYFVRAILPQIRKAIPSVKLYIVGSKPAPVLKKLANTSSDIIVTGYVDQVRPYVVKSAAFVAPMQIGRGINNKIIEAMAMGVPVVTNSLGLEGIRAVPGHDLLVEDAPENFAAQVIRLMTDAEFRHTIAGNARKTIATHYNWDTNLENLNTILCDVVAHFHTSQA
ncbi:MAG: TIGR03087 family PEP-CTERM/XrtA system glycosyltransferase [Lentisphaerae bacterium]|nr:TIGR03087 family PEP-CTERM/XrtA system glycosyltransferase [Lentisphaerota bacterium]